MLKFTVIWTARIKSCLLRNFGEDIRRGSFVLKLDLTAENFPLHMGTWPMSCKCQLWSWSNLSPPSQVLAEDGCSLQYLFLARFLLTFQVVRYELVLIIIPCEVFDNLLKYWFCLTTNTLKKFKLIESENSIYWESPDNLVVGLPILTQRAEDR